MPIVTWPLYPDEIFGTLNLATMDKALSVLLSQGIVRLSMYFENKSYVFAWYRNLLLTHSGR